MKLKFQRKNNPIVNAIMIMLLSAFTIFTTYSWGRYVMLVCIASVFMIDVIDKRLIYKCIFGKYFIMLAVFAIYVLLSAVWAEDYSDSISMGKTLIEILFMIFVLNNYYDSNTESVKELLNIIKWSSYIIVIYSICYYGIDGLAILLAEDIRMDNTYANVNTIGMFSAVGILIQVDEVLRDKKISLISLLCIPSIILLAVTQSRKAFVILLVGITIIFLLKNENSKDIRKSVLKLIISIVVLAILIRLLLSFSVFSGMMNRMEGLIAGITGTGRVDGSTRLRNKMVALGWRHFLETPIFGMGVGSSHLLAAKYLGRDEYLHNNFIELLSGGGIVGFFIYYSMYIYLFWNFWKYRKYKNREYNICFTIMTVFFAMDYGRVSYYSKMTYVYFLLYFLEVEKLKKTAQQSIEERNIVYDKKNIKIYI